MTPVCGFPCEGTHNACIARPNCSPCSRRATATLRIPLCHQVAIRSTRRPIAAASARHGRKGFCCRSSLLDQAWGTHVNAQELATNIFSTSIVPYSAFLYWLTKSRKTPPLALFGFYFLLVFVFATIPAGVVALKVYHKSLANVDILHGSAESMLTVTNLLIVLGLRQGVRQAEQTNQQQSEDVHPAQSSSADAAKQQ